MADVEHTAESNNATSSSSPGSPGRSTSAPHDKPHPHLHEPLLYIAGLDPQLDDGELATSIFAPFLPVRLNIDREAGPTASGSVEFQTIDKAEKALATIVNVKLSITSPGSAEPSPRGKPLLIKQLPPTTDNGFLYDLFRPIGPVALAECILTNPQGQYTGFRGIANVVFYSQEDAEKAQNELNCVEIEGKLISVRPDPFPRRSQDGAAISAQAAPFVPGAKMSAQAPAFAPTSAATSIYAYTSPPDQMDHRKGPIWAVPGTNLQYSSSASTYIDPCNLFCKNLCPSIDSSDLYEIFKPFGRIVSARVMRDGGKSREFGFVSFTSPEDAAQALHAINGQRIGSKVIMVRLHEPKKMRQEKLSKMFGGGDTLSTNGGGISPGRGVSPHSPRPDLADAGFPATVNAGFDEVELAGMDEEDRSNLILGEFIKRSQALPELAADEDQIRQVVLGLSQLNLADQVKALNDPAQFKRSVTTISHGGVSPATQTAELSGNPAATPVAESIANPISPSSLAAPTHLAVPQVNGSSLSGASDAVSVTSNNAAASSKERARLLSAVSQLMPSGSPIEDVTDLLAGMTKKDRAMALFNRDFLKIKVDEAKEILDITADDGEDVVGEPESVKAVKDAPVVKSPTAAATSPSSATAAEETPATPTANDETHTLSSLARLSCQEVLALADKASKDKSSPGLPLPKADSAQWQKTEEMVDRILEEKREAERKQKLGDVLFKKIKSFGIKGAPKITIRLLDSEDLRSLAHVMDSYPELLQEKVTLIQQQEKAKKT